MKNDELEIRKELIRNAHILQVISMIFIIGVLIAVALLRNTSLRYYSIVAGSLCLCPIGVIVITTVVQLGHINYELDALMASNRHIEVLNRVATIVLYSGFGLLIAGMITAISIGL